MTERQKICWFEWARAIGALAIVALHAVVVTQQEDVLVKAAPALFWWEGLLAIPLTRWAVPVFFMISGALLLDPGWSFDGRKLGRYVWRMAFLLLTLGLAFCVIENVADLVEDGGTLGFSWQLLGDSLLDLLEANSWDHLWYVYALIGLYLLTPVLRPFVAKATRRSLGVACLVAWAMLCLVPACNWIFHIRLYRFIKGDAAIAYFLVGAWAYRYLRLDWRVLVAGLASLAICVAPTAASVIAGQGVLTPEVAQAAIDAGGWGFSDYGLILPFALLVFLLFRHHLDLPLEPHPVVSGLARDSFGIYLLHPIFGHLAVWLLDLSSVPVALLQLGIFCVGVLGSVVLTRLLRLVPGFKGKL